MIEPVRRVVVRPDRDGKTTVALDGPSPHVHTLPGMTADLGLTDLWYTGDDAATGASDAADRDLAVAPPAGGSLFRVVQFPPDEAGSEPFWHETSTVDYNVVLSGELVLQLDTGTVPLRAGDTIVVCGGRHAWSNPSTAPAILAAVSVSAGADST
jgi:quercetin dioxygenase-like cupin family protein